MHLTAANRSRLARALITTLLLALPALDVLGQGPGETTVEHLVVSNNLSQLDAAGTNYFLGKLGLGTNDPSARLTITRWEDNENIINAYKGEQPYERFAMKMVTESTDDYLILVVNGSNVFTLCENGKLGLGALYPAANANVRLDIEQGDLRLSSASRLIFSDSSLDQQNWSMHSDGDSFSLREMEHNDSEAFRIVDRGNNAQEFTFKGQSDTNTTWVTIAGTGDLGLGTAEPAAKLDVVGDARISGQATIAALYPQGDIAMGSYTNVND